MGTRQSSDGFGFRRQTRSGSGHKRQKTMPHANPSRRDFLALSAAAAATTATGTTAAAAGALLHGRGRAPKKVLVLGGTRFLGPAIVDALLAGGHEVTLFNRGISNPEMYPDLEKLEGQRRRPEYGSRGQAQDLTALENRKWDIAIDTGAYYPHNVSDLAAILRDNVGHYVIVSSISAYANLGKDNAAVTEDSPLGELDDPDTAQMTNESYGPLKVACERVIEEAFPGRATLIRPGYIIGPDDPFDRLTSRVVRLAQGGDTLAPGNPDAELQMIDVKDLGAFIAKTGVEQIAGPFNATGFEGKITVEAFHHACQALFAHDTTLEWVSDAFLEANKVSPWGEIACWTPDASRNFTHVERAIAAGLTFRPLANTLRDTHEWATTKRPDRPWRGGMKPGREEELLTAWRKR